MSSSPTKPPVFERLQNHCQRLFAFFPALMVALVAWSTYQFVQAPSLGGVARLGFVIYGLPLILYRLINWIAPMQEGYSYVSGVAGFSTWMTAMRLQAFYNAFPMFERALLLIPGAFSLWLRLWGSRIGRMVYWTPRVEVVDRTHLDVGDMAVFGDKCYLSAHIVRFKNRRILLYLKTIKIGDRAMIGFASCLGPGVTVDADEVVPVGSGLLPNTHFKTRHREPSHEQEKPGPVGPVPGLRRRRLSAETRPPAPPETPR